MSADRRSVWHSPLVRVGIVLTPALVVLGLILLGNASSQAEGAVISKEAAAGFQTKDKLLVTLAVANPDGKNLRGTLRVELTDRDGKPFASAKRNVVQNETSASYRFELPVPRLRTDQVKVRCYFEKQKFEVPLSEILLAKEHETSVTASQEFYAGSIATIRCGVHGVKSIAENVPLAGADVEIRLKAKDGEITPLYKGKAGKDGIAAAEFKVPAVTPGQYTLEIETQSTLGKETLARDIRVKAQPKVLLITDKPLYQPGQQIRIRALALGSFNLAPVSGKELLFEVEDAKGNKVFKKSQKTSDFGIASLDFQLADEVNMGEYQIRATLGDQEARKTVTVKKYVLPKFKNELTADKRYYMPKETIQADLQTDYFFGKPVAGGKVVVKASTFDVQFRDFQKWEGKTDDNGHAKFEIKLPDYFVGQPLQKGDAIVKLEVKVTDTADHSETITKTYPVSNAPLRVSLIPEGGRLVPGMENRVFAAAIYPDGSPAACEVKLWTGNQAKGNPVATLKTNEAGLAEFKVTPKPEQFRQGQWGQRTIEMLGGQSPQIWGPQMLFDMTVEAKDQKGPAITFVTAVNSDPMGENIILRLDKAIYQGGDTVNVDVRSSAGLPTAYLDIIKGGQTLLTKWLDVKDGKAAHKLDLPAEVFGTLELHAYQTLASGEIIRDSRVVYVQPREELKIDVKAEKDVFKPGEDGKIRFQVTDSSGRPTAAALGVIIVDESVYALQEMQPGLEKVYFTLQEELLKPQAQAVFKPREGIDTLIQQPALPAPQQQIAEVLLTAVKPKPPARWEVDPAFARRQKLEGQIQQIGWALFNYASNDKSFMVYDKGDKEWHFKTGLLEDAVKAQHMDASLLKDPFGKAWTTESLAKLDKDFTADRLAQAITANRVQQISWTFINYTQQNQAKFLKNKEWKFPKTILADAAKAQRLGDMWLKDAWGEPLRLVKTDKKRDHKTGWTQLDYYELVSAGPDGKFGTKDDIKVGDPNNWYNAGMWWLGDDARQTMLGFDGGFRGRNGAFRRGALREEQLFGHQLEAAPGRGFGGGGGLVPLAAAADANKFMAPATKELAKNGEGKGGGQGGSAAPTMRIREYFPETMLWQPALITDDQGVAILPVSFADSITTWRLTASASSRGGLLGGVTAPLRVFQDFFVDLDLPVSLTQNDEVAFPVAVYNYLKEPQTVKLELKKENWFELIDTAGANRTLDLKPNEVTAVKFRIRAKRIGFHPLTVLAQGTKLSDAIKRPIEIVPDGRKIETVVTDRLEGRVSQSVEIPEQTISESAKILVKLYPGVFSQVLEGTEGMLRLPGG